MFVQERRLTMRLLRLLDLVMMYYMSDLFSWPNISCLYVIIYAHKYLIFNGQR